MSEFLGSGKGSERSVWDCYPVCSRNSPMYWQFEITTPCVALGYGGSVSPGQVIFLAPYRYRDELYQWAVGKINTDWIWLYAVHDAPPWLIVLRPGEVVQFRETLRDGVAGVVCAPEHSLAGLSYLYANAGIGLPLPANIGEQLELHTNRCGLPALPVLRVFAETASAIPAGLSYDRVPAFGFATLGVATPVWNDTNLPECQQPTKFIPVGPCVTHVTIGVVKGVTPGPPAVVTRLDQDIPLRVWWLSSDGISHCNPANDWTAAGLGLASATHDCETYYVPRNCRKVAVQALAAFAGTVHYTVTMTDGEA
jgi:hypothetical protein